MKNILSIAIVILLAFATVSNAATLSAIYDFRDQLNAVATSFEGLDFDEEGALWITSAPNLASNTLLKVELETETVLGVFDYSGSPNPVGLAINESDIFVTNVPGGTFSVSIDGSTAVTGENVLPSSNWAAFFFNLGCTQPEGAAYYNEHIYVSCETGKVFEIDPQTGTYIEIFSSDKEFLGLGATNDGELIIGGYNSSDKLDRSLIRYDVLTNKVTDTIDLNELFVGADSDYTTLTGEAYEVTIADNGDIRYIPDPDGIAYRDGKIYMTFEHDLRVYEISLDPPVATPEPGTLLLLGAGLLGLFAWKRKRS